MRTILTRLRGFLATRAGRMFLAILVVAVGIRIPLMTFRGYYSDLATYIGWGNTVVQHFFDIYTSTAATGFGAASCARCSIATGSTSRKSNRAARSC